jgi:hypothetical protein
MCYIFERNLFNVDPIIMKAILTLVILTSCAISFAQVGDTFPPLDGETLTNKLVNIPNDIKGKYGLIGMAFSKKSENDLNTWYSPIYNQFIYKPKKPALFAGNYDINVFFVPMFTGAKRPAYKKVMKKVKDKMDPVLRPYVLFYQGTMKAYKKPLSFDQGRDLPYFFVIDPEGKIVYTTNGKYTDRKMREIVEAVEASYN